MIMELLELLRQYIMPQEANLTFELCAYIDSLEKKLDAMTEELTNVKQHLKDMQEDTVLNNLKAQVQAAAERLQDRCNMMKEQLFVVKDIKSGEKFTEENVRSIRPGYGLAPKYYNEILNREVITDLEKGTPLSWDKVK